MHVSFLMFRLSEVCFFIYVSFRAVVSAFWAFLSSRRSSALYRSYCIVSVFIQTAANDFRLPKRFGPARWQQLDVIGKPAREYLHRALTHALTDTTRKTMFPASSTTWVEAQ